MKEEQCLYTHLFHRNICMHISRHNKTKSLQFHFGHVDYYFSSVVHRTVRNNFRVCLIAGEGGTNLQRRCREYPAFTKNVNFIWFPHWSKTQLVEHALYHLNGK